MAAIINSNNSMLRGVGTVLPPNPGADKILSTDSEGTLVWMPKYSEKYPQDGIIHIDSDNSMWVGAFYNTPVHGSLDGATFSTDRWIYNVPVPSPSNYAFGSCWLQLWPYVYGARTNNTKIGVTLDLYLKDGGRHGLFGADNLGLRLEDSVAGFIAESRGHHIVYIEDFYRYDYVEVTLHKDSDLTGTEDMRLDYQFVFNAWLPGGY